MEISQNFVAFSESMNFNEVHGEANPMFNQSVGNLVLNADLAELIFPRQIL